MTILIVTLNVHGLNTPMKREIVTVGLCLWTVNFTSFFFVCFLFLPHLGRTEWLEWAEVGYNPSPRSVRL